MAIERLSFEAPDSTYHSYFAAQHVVRYASVKNLVAGKRVLDVACGEGYGCHLLLEWGAREVVGVDNLPAAVEIAGRLFGDERATYVVGDAEALDDVVGDVERFDLIVSFETIEHLVNPGKFLAALPKLLTADGIIVVSCPNDLIDSGNPENNPFHMARYTFEQFKALTQRHLGKPSMWMLGCALLGQANYIRGDDFVEKSHHDPLSITNSKSVANTITIPAQSNLVTSDETCAHYIGVWGAELAPNAAISSLSIPAYLEPWSVRQNLLVKVEELEKARVEYFEPELRQRDAEIEKLRTANTQLRADLSNLNGQLADQYKPEIELQKARISQLLVTNGQQETKVEFLSEQNAKLQGRIDTELEPELSELRSQLDQARGQVSELRRDKESRDAVEATTKALLTELEVWKAQHYEPELSRLQEEIDRHEKAKAELYEPQLEEQRAEIARLQKVNFEIDAKSAALVDRIGELESLIGKQLEPEISVLKSELMELEVWKAEHYEPELARLKRHVEHSVFEKEVQSLRRLLIASADRYRNEIDRAAALAQKLKTLENDYENQIQRLHDVIANFEKTKQEWWDPELERRANRIAYLEARADSTYSGSYPVASK